MKKALALALACTLGLTSVNATVQVKANSFENNPILYLQEPEMNEQQLSSISMLNYLTVLSQEINASQSSRVFLDNAYSSIVNNINPNAVDEKTMSQIKSLLNTINAYQNIDKKRERLEYIYKQNQAVALRKAIPNPMSVLNVVQSGNALKAAVSVLYMAVDSKASYDAYMTDIENQYLQDGWKLDDEADQNMHESRVDAFEYMVEMCNKNGLNGKLALNEDSVKEFVSYENNNNVVRRIDFLEKNESTYQAYGRYWLVLAESYYENGDYSKCLSAIEEYESLNIDTFRKDHDYAKTLSVGLIAAQESYGSYKYNKEAPLMLEKMEENLENSDWMLRYFIAESYLDLYGRTSNRDYLQKAYDLTETNVNYLIDEQKNQNKLYLEDIKLKEEKKTDTKEVKKEIKNYNKMLKEERKVALPPVYQPLVANCELLFGIAEELNISDKQKNKIDSMLHPNGEALFLVDQIDSKYGYNVPNKEQNYSIEFDGDTIQIPAALLTQDTMIKVTVSEGKNSKEFTDWTVKKVDRTISTKIDTFTATYTSKDIKKQKYTEKTKVTLEIIPSEESNCDSLKYTFKTNVGKKLGFLDDVTFTMEK